MVDNGIIKREENPVLEYEDFDELRERALKDSSLHIISPQKGGQEEILSCPADIVIGGGSRGGGKTAALLMETLYDVYKDHFRALLMRKEIEDLSDMIETSQMFYSQFGEYNRSKSDMRWNYHNGGFLKFAYHAGSIEDFKTRFQGKQFAYIGVDEITHMEYQKFKYLITCNRNAFGIRNRFIGTCNPDPDSWVAKFISWWIGEDGYPVKERDSVIRYCFMDGDDVSTVIWGDTREEVYLQAKDIIDRYWKPEYLKYGSPQELFVKSVAFVEAKLADNEILLKSDPSYLANLANQSEEQRERDLGGNWKFKMAGDDMIKIPHMEKFFEAPALPTENETRYATCDAAFEGGDNLTLWLWKGWHIADLAVFRLNAKDAVLAIKGKLEEWGVREEYFTYDLNGLGQVFKGFFPRALPFLNNEAVDEKFRNIYGNIKSQAAYMFAKKLIDGEISIAPDLLERRYSGKGYANTKLRDILMRERKAIRKDEKTYDKGWCIIKKSAMKRLIGHSPDFIEGLLERMIFEIKHKQRRIKGLGLL